MAADRGPGRPPSDDPLASPISVRLTESEKALAKAAAAIDGISESKFARLAVVAEAKRRIRAAERAAEG